MILTILLVILILAAFSGGFANNGAYAGPGFGLGGILVLVFLVLLLTHVLVI